MVIALFVMGMLFVTTLTLVVALFRRLPRLGITAAFLVMVILLWGIIYLGLQVWDTIGDYRVDWIWWVVQVLVFLSIAAMAYQERRRRKGGSGREHQ